VTTFTFGLGQQTPVLQFVRVCIRIIDSSKKRSGLFVLQAVHNEEALGRYSAWQGPKAATHDWGSVVKIGFCGPLLLRSAPFFLL
jgi:hypothetical protein